MDDMWMTPGVVLHKIWQLRQVSGWHSGWHMSSASQISPEVSLSCHPQVIYTSSAGHLHVICTCEISTPKYFQSKSRTALLKIRNTTKFGLTKIKLITIGQRSNESPKWNSSLLDRSILFFGGHQCLILPLIFLILTWWFLPFCFSEWLSILFPTYFL